ncbi:DUF1284 domain-containing protein [Desulfofundulus thermobenzoicus]|uniref:DUF1284 domain-containing protein n=1 Tax=Desulfofundulus thermobenzoicus TaxID=29376 RepID=A0A6N7IP73_9FIRM|nr:DUF1284 domain-containing protein [Desulfofundulus thermobenzoicus]HHW45206.1 DUF1284 domain-containing protein [Desulfotomaculum sp.]
MQFRGHHLICLHFFQGEGYDRDYIDNLKNLVDRAEKGEEITVVAGADDVCRACPHLEGERCMHGDGADGEIRRLDQMALDYLGIPVGEKVLWADLQKKVGSAPRQWFDLFCRGCDWEKLCHIK